MKRSASLLVLLLILLVFASLPLICCVGASSVMWSQTYGGGAIDSAWDIIQTNDDGYAIAGATGSFGARLFDVWLIKIDAFGNMLWNQTYGGSGIDGAFSLIETSDGGFALAGDTNSFGAGNYDFLLIKTDANGNMEWNKTYGGSNIDQAQAIVQTSDGGFALAGYTESFGSGSYDSWLIKTDSNGNMVWNQTYGGEGMEVASSLVETSDGGYALGGQTTSGVGHFDFLLVKTDAYGNMEWNQTYGGTSWDQAYCLVEASDGGYALAGRTNSFGAGSYDCCLVKTDANGNMQWNQTYGGPEWDEVHSLVETSDGGYALAGETESFGADNYDSWLVKTDGTGNIVWNQTYGGTENDRAYSLIETSGGGYALAGETKSFGAGEYDDVWLVKTDEHGVIPEFPSWAPMLLTLIALTVILAVYRKRLPKTPNN